MMVSIPKRVSEALKLPAASTDKFILRFQSLKGFQRLWSCNRFWKYIYRNVSIPKRVSEALKRAIASFNHMIFDRFQSLKGFQRLWSLGSKISIKTFLPVSIPKRVSEALKLSWLIVGFKMPLFQSLKGFQSLWRLWVKLRSFYQIKFQSLKGFQRLWSERLYKFQLPESCFNP